MRSRSSRFVFVVFMAAFGIAAAALYSSKVLAIEGWSNQCTSSISANFNGAAIPAGSSIWFTSVLTPAGQLSNPGTGAQGAVYVKEFSVSFKANGITYSCYNHQPVNVLNFSKTATIGQLIYYQSSNSWISNYPTGLRGNVVLAPCILAVPANLPGGIQPVTWTMTFKSDTEQPVVWQWGAAVYSQFPLAQYASCGTNCYAGGETGTRFDLVHPKAVDDIPSQDCVNPTGDPFTPGSGTTSCSAPYAELAGTPEGVNSDNQRWKQFLVKGGTSNGGSNWTGTLSSKGSCTPLPTT